MDYVKILIRSEMENFAIIWSNNTSGRSIKDINCSTILIG